MNDVEYDRSGYENNELMKCIMQQSDSSGRQRLVIVGGGQAAAQLVTSLRPVLTHFHVTLVAGEKHLPYQRPPLSKTFFEPGFECERLLFKDAAFYRDAGVTVLRGVKATDVDRHRALVTLDDSSALPYDYLVLATGAVARRLDLPGSTLDGILTLRSLDDARLLASHLHAGRTMVVIGGGYIGLEVAASSRRAGMNVTVLQSGSRVLDRVASPYVAKVLSDLHRERGVTIRTDVKVTGFVSDAGGNSVAGVQLADGKNISADVVVLGVGVDPKAGLARTAGLEIEHGAVVVDRVGRTSDPRIFAAGDCTCVEVPHLGRRVRLESVSNAVAQARAIAAFLAGQPLLPLAVPWFWSEQFDSKVQIAGLAAHYDETVLRDFGARGASSAPAFVEFYLDRGKLVSGAALNRPADFMALRRYLDEVGPEGVVDPLKLADPSVPLGLALAGATSRLGADGVYAAEGGRR
ncbi:NAD(P)/FAD-dependent oxidoreductase [Paraburkholderia sp. B3]|uniref:NAD(P)/FAD-dependent oxidoreductase n=1 Tax=Paraburkholderia sp. B3 TaxID=3134791 RepID=UPI003981F5C2